MNGEEELEKSGHIQEKIDAFMNKIQHNYSINHGDMKDGLKCIICDQTLSRKTSRYMYITDLSVVQE